MTLSDSTSIDIENWHIPLLHRQRETVLLAPRTEIALRDHLEWLALRGYSQGSIYTRHRAVVRLAETLGGDLLTVTAERLLDWRRGLTVADTTIASYVSNTREFYAWAHTRGLIDSNPAAGLPVPKLGRRLPRPIGQDDLFLAIQTAPERVRPWLVLASHAGLRACEIAWLRVERILDRADPPVLLIAEDATKGKNERVIPMSEFVLGELYRAGLERIRGGYMFTRRDGIKYQPNKPWTISGLANKHLHACGLTETLHTLRHWFGTSVYRASGNDLRATQELLGHANPATTAGYAEYNRTGAIEAVNRLDTPGLRLIEGGGETETGA